MSSLPTYQTRDLILERLLKIFPEGSPARAYCTREIAASTVFAMLYVGAVEGGDQYLAPKHVYRMSDEQAVLGSDAARLEYALECTKSGFVARGKPWYADTTREPIRDETLRQGLIAVGAAFERRGLSTTSSKPRYQLAADFAALFDPSLKDDELGAQIKKWQETHLTKGAIARIALVRAGASKDTSGVLVEFPNGDTRKLSPGASSQIAKQVIESFASRFLEHPAVLWLSESGNKVLVQDDVLSRKIGLQIDPSRNLPDIILADLGGKDATVLLVFVEVVATDGPISEQRREELLKIARDAGFEAESVAFVTAFLDRDLAVFKRTFGSLAWNSFAWIASEPAHIVALHRGDEAQSVSLRKLLKAASS
jgi:hypothetical protein